MQTYMCGKSSCDKRYYPDSMQAYQVLYLSEVQDFLRRDLVI